MTVIIVRVVYDNTDRDDLMVHTSHPSPFRTSGAHQKNIVRRTSSNMAKDAGSDMRA